MKTYNPKKGLIFIHIPKCAGKSINRLLKNWFGKNFARHGFKKNSVWFRTKPYEVKPQMCISGHFSRSKGVGVKDLYPEVDQFITFLRDPFEMALSLYYFWKQKRRALKLENGTLTIGSEQDYKNIIDFFKKNTRSHMLDYMPCDITEDNYKEVINEYFVYIGIVEDIQTSANTLSKIIGFPLTNIERLNIAIRDEALPEDMKEAFIANNRLEYLIYNYILTNYKI